MSTCVEITALSLRLVTVVDGAIAELKSMTCEAGIDPVQLLPSILPPKAGNVRVLLSTADCLVRMIVQPPCARDRLDRLMEFELTGGGGDDAPLADWLVVPGFGSGDVRVLGWAVKRALVQRLTQSLALAGARLEAIAHPAIGLYHAWRMAGGMGDALLADVGGTATHVAIVRQDELAMVRTVPVGMDALVEQVVGLRGLSQPEAVRLISQLRATSPEELQQLVNCQAGQVAVGLTGVIKFAKAQLQVDDWQPLAIALAGAGAQVHGFADAVAERAGIPTKPFNPFAPLRCTLPSERMDALSALPSPWSAAIGLAAVKKPALDALADQRRTAARFWATDGILRVGVAAAVILVLSAIAVQDLAINRADGDITKLGGEAGLVPRAERDLAEIAKLEVQRQREAKRLGWIDNEHRASRIASEVLSAVASLQHPENCPVALAAYRVKRTTDATLVELEGFAQSVGRLRTSDVLHAFEQGLRSTYAPISAIEERPRPIDRDRQQFHLVLTLPDVK